MSPLVIKRLRGKLTRKEAAARSGFSLRTIESWEQGARKPTQFSLAYYTERVKANGK